MYTTEPMYTTWNTLSETPTKVTRGYSEKYDDIVTNTGKKYFLGVVTNASDEVTNAYACAVKDGVPFCIEGTSDGSKYNTNSSLINGSSLWNGSCTVNVSEGSTYCGPQDGISLTVGSDSLGSVVSGVSIDNNCKVTLEGLFECNEG
jgi:hypothetical protein